MKTIQQKINEGREYRDMTMTVKIDEPTDDKNAMITVPSNDEPFDDERREMIVEGYATTFEQSYDLYWLDDKTLVKERVLKSAFDETDLSDVIMQYDHEGRVFARVSNQTLQLIVDDFGLKTIANLGGTEIGRQLYDEIKKQYTTKMSFGFIVGGDEITEQQSDDITIYTRTITKIDKVFDVSAVSLPANNGTTIFARGRIDGLIDEYRAECKKRVENRKAKELKIKQLRARINLMKKGN